MVSEFVSQVFIRFGRIMERVARGKKLITAFSAGGHRRKTFNRSENFEHAFWHVYHPGPTILHLSTAHLRWRTESTEVPVAVR